MKKVIFKGSGVAIVTPFDAQNNVNFDKLGELIEYQLANSTDALVVCGTTGEASTLSDREHIDVIYYAVKKATGRVPVIAGTGSNETEHALELSKEAESAGADALLIVTPYYNKTTQNGLVRHYTYIADRVDLPIIVYNVPSRTGLNILPETYRELSKHPNIVAVKEANSNIAAIAKTRALCGDELHIYSGNDDQIVPILSLGGLGVISVLANIMPQRTHDICSLYFEGDTKASAELQISLMELIDALFCEVNPIPVKTAMNLMGFNVGGLRMPLFEMQDKNKDTLKAAMLRAGLPVH